MAQHNIRTSRRHRHEGRTRGGAAGGKSHGGRQTQFATAGEERAAGPGRDSGLSDFDPKYGQTTEAGSGGEHPSGYGEQFGQGFGVGAHHGLQENGGPREREYRGNAGTTYGATVGPDALKEDTSADKRADDKPGG